MPQNNIGRLRETLNELFMIDQADLDFGLYRIMNVRRDEIRRFLDRNLLPKVRQVLDQMQENERTALQTQLDDATEQARQLGFNDPSEAPRVRELRERLQGKADIEEDESEVYGHLVSFLRRYFKEGDFISLRRYKDGVYAIPYAGEEIKLHWANADQYYTKTTERFKDYTFIVSEEGEPHRRVHFKLISADTERNNNRALVGQERQFMLAEDESVAEVDGELRVPFVYRPSNGTKQAALNAEAESTILGDLVSVAWSATLARDVRREGAKDPLTLLRKHLNTYTAKNTYDYFIHKDLGGFLRRELDFYLKNEVLHLDDIDTYGATAQTLDRQLRKMKAIRAVALPIIDFVASLEDFQKLLWLKKKFVVEAHWCVTLDRVQPTFYPEITKNERQREAWVRLFAIDEIEGDDSTPPYSEPLTESFLEANPYLVLDTSLFDQSFSERLLDGIENLDEETDGLLVSSENFQALHLLQSSVRGQIDCVYIDPPYNSPSTAILYKNNYLHSSWLSLLSDRLRLSSHIAGEAPTLIAVDDHEGARLAMLLDQICPDSDITCVSIVNNPRGQQGDNFKHTHEYCFFVLPPGSKRVRPKPIPREKWEYTPLRNWGGESDRADGGPDTFYPIFVEDDRIVGVGEPAKEDFHPVSVVEQINDGKSALWPVDKHGREKKWRYARTRLLDMLSTDPRRLRVHDVDGEQQIQIARVSEDRNTVWVDSRYDASTHGTRLLTHMLGVSGQFSYPKSVNLVRECIGSVSGETARVLDYFAGSGTTAHAVIDLNREDNGTRKYILVETGEYFDTVLKPRVLKAAYSKDWKDGKPVERVGVSQLIKVIRLESYEDTLANLRVRRTQQQTHLLEQSDEHFREQYALRYWIKEETLHSASLLDFKQFDDPWSYTLEIGQSSTAETKTVTVDLVETFNYLLGLRVRRVKHAHGATLVQGDLPPAPGQVTGGRALVIWRNAQKMDAEALDKFLWDQRINPRDMGFDVIYVNGDNYLENARRPDENWKVRLIEDEFHRLMFEAVEQEPSP